MFVDKFSFLAIFCTFLVFLRIYPHKKLNFKFVIFFPIDGGYPQKLRFLSQLQGKVSFHE